jgi:hypothetical protein
VKAEPLATIDGEGLADGHLKGKPWWADARGKDSAALRRRPCIALGEPVQNTHVEVSTSCRRSDREPAGAPYDGQARPARHCLISTRRLLSMASPLSLSVPMHTLH